MKHTKKALFFRLLWYIIMILVSLVFCFPVLYLIFTGFKTPQETVAFPPTLIPKKWTLSAYEEGLATVYKGNIIKNLIMDCQSYTKYRPNETTGGIFVSWRRKEELPTGA